MAEDKPPAPLPQRESTWERLKKTIFDLRITVLELWGLIAFVLWLAWYIYSTYTEMERRVAKIESEIEKQGNAYKNTTESMRQLLSQFDKRLDQVQQDVNSLKK